MAPLAARRQSLRRRDQTHAGESERRFTLLEPGAHRRMAVVPVRKRLQDGARGWSLPSGIDTAWVGGVNAETSVCQCWPST
jgi:hypothetical protein